MPVMMREPLVEALITINPGRIGEINLLLDVLSTGKKTAVITKRALIEMAGKSDGSTKSNEYIVIGKAVQLISDSNDELELTKFGRQVISVATWPPYDRLNQRQIELLAPEFVGHPAVKFHVLSFLSRLTRLHDKRSVYLLGSQNIDQEEITCVQILQVLGIFTAINEYLSISHHHLMELSSYLGENLFQSEEDLWQVLHEANLRARAAEEYILVYEQVRLKSEGRDDLCNLVKRVSEYNVNAGYDIRSFNADGSTRYIEVKSAKNLALQFYMSIAEFQFAENHCNEHWIYFVPRSQDLPNLKYGPILLFAPSDLLKEGILSIESSNFRIGIQQEIQSVDDSRIIQGLLPDIKE